MNEIPGVLVLNNSFFFFVLSALILWGAYIRVDFNQRFLLVTRGFVFERYFNQLLKVEKINNNSSSIYFNFNFLLNFSFFIFNLLIQFKYPITFNFGYYYILLFFAFAVALKTILKDLLSNLLFFRFFKELKLNQLLYYQNLGLLLLIQNFIFVLIYSDYHKFLLNYGVVTIVMLFVFKTYREIKISLQNKISIFYIILYLCALEIIPLLVIYRFLSE